MISPHHHRHPAITCPSCGGTAHLLPRPEELEGMEPGAILPYRCEDCGERSDVVLEDDDDS